MATTLDLTSLAGPTQTRYFAGGDAADWCKVSGPAWARCVTVANHGSGKAWVSIPALTGTRAATDHAVELASGEHRTFYLSEGRAKAPSVAWSVFGADGAAHVYSFHIESSSS